MKTHYLLFDYTRGGLRGDTRKYLADGAEYEIEAARELDLILETRPNGYVLSFDHMNEPYSNGYLLMTVPTEIELKGGVNYWDNGRYLNSIGCKDAGAVFQTFIEDD